MALAGLLEVNTSPRDKRARCGHGRPQGSMGGTPSDADATMNVRGRYHAGEGESSLAPTIGPTPYLRHGFQHQQIHYRSMQDSTSDSSIAMPSPGSVGKAIAP